MTTTCAALAWSPVGLSYVFVLVLLGALIYGIVQVVRFARKARTITTSGYAAIAVCDDPLIQDFNTRLHLRKDGGLDPAELDEARQLVRDGFESRILPPRFIANAAVYFGLLGTLIGLSMAVQSLSTGVPGNATAASFDRFLVSSQDALRGFGTAFTAALFGVLVTLVLGAFLTWYDRTIDDLLTVLSEYALSEHPDPTTRKEPETGPEFIAELQRSFSAVEQTLVRLLEAVESSNRGQTAIIESHKTLVEESVTSLRGIAQAAIGEFQSRLSEQAKAYEDIQQAVRESADEASRHLGEVSKATREASSEIRDAIQAAQREREQTEESIMGLAEASERIRASTDLLGTNLAASAELVSVAKELGGTVTKASTSLDALSSQTQEALNEHKRDLETHRNAFLNGLQSHAIPFHAIADKVVEAVEQHQAFVEQAVAMIAEIPVTVETGRLFASSDDQFKEVLEALHGLDQSVRDSSRRDPESPVTQDDAVLSRLQRIENAVLSLGRTIQVVDGKVTKQTPWYMRPFRRNREVG